MQAAQASSNYKDVSTLGQQANKTDRKPASTQKINQKIMPSASKAFVCPDIKVRGTFIEWTNICYKVVVLSNPCRFSWRQSMITEKNFKSLTRAEWPKIRTM